MRVWVNTHFSWTSRVHLVSLCAMAGPEIACHDARPARDKEARSDARYHRKIARAKRKEYPRRTPEQWTAMRCAERGVSFESVVDTIPRLDVRTSTAEEFRERFERPGLPVMLTGAMDAWPANHAWTFERLRADYGREKMKVGEDDEGYPVWVKLKHYLRYLAETNDDSPLYVFDSSFYERAGVRALADAYSPPAFFADDLFGLVGEKRRPPYKWFVMGPKRSGSYVAQRAAPPRRARPRDKPPPAPPLPLRL